MTKVGPWIELTRHFIDPGTLAKLAGRYDVKIDVSRHRSIVRFTADPITCFRMCKDIEAVLGNIRCLEFNLAPLQPSSRKRSVGRLKIDSSTKHWVAKVTGTEIQEDVKGQKVSSLMLSALFHVTN